MPGARPAFTNLAGAGAQPTCSKAPQAEQAALLPCSDRGSGTDLWAEPALKSREALLPDRQSPSKALVLCLLIKGESSQVFLVLTGDRPHITAAWQWLAASLMLHMLVCMLRHTGWCCTDCTLACTDCNGIAAPSQLNVLSCMTCCSAACCSAAWHSRTYDLLSTSASTPLDEVLGKVDECIMACAYQGDTRQMKLMQLTRRSRQP